MTLSTNEALKQVISEIRAMSPQELRAELDKHKDGELAIALREAGEFLYNYDPEVKEEVK